MQHLHLQAYRRRIKYEYENTQRFQMDPVYRTDTLQERFRLHLNTAKLLGSLGFFMKLDMGKVEDHDLLGWARLTMQYRTWIRRGYGYDELVSREDQPMEDMMLRILFTPKGATQEEFDSMMVDFAG
jgi:hypothetical protein